MAAAAADRGMKVTATARPGSAFALCIGNTAYAASPLLNAANDAEDVAALCRALGFSTQLLLQASLDQMLDAVDAFAHKLPRGGVALFFFAGATRRPRARELPLSPASAAGHGIEDKGSNYLIPTEYKEEDSQRLDYKALKVSSVLERLEGAGCHLNLVVLDACRAKPLPARGGARGLSRGLAKIEAPAGTLVAFACAPGHTASDGAGRNGVFTESLLRHLGSPGLDIDFVMRAVVNDVEKASNGQQVPFRDSSLKVTPCCLIEALPAAAAAPAEAPAVASPAAAIDAELAAFLESCRLDAGQRGEVAVALRGIGVSSGSHLDLCQEEDLQGLPLPPVTLRVLRAGLKTRRDAAAGASDEAERTAKAAAAEAARRAQEEAAAREQAAAAAAAKAAAQRAADAKAAEEAAAKIAKEKQAAAEAQRVAEAQAAAKRAAEAKAAEEEKRKRALPAAVPALSLQAQMKGQTSLILENKKLGYLEAVDLAHALKVNTTLTRLYLDHNCISDIGARSLAEALKVNESLTELRLGDNGIGDAGASALAEALRVNKTLTKLHLDYNRIGDAGASALAELLKVNKTLTTLFLAHSKIGDMGASALAGALKVNKALTKLYLSSSSISNAGAAALRDSARSGCTIYGLPSAPAAPAAAGGCCSVM